MIEVRRRNNKGNLQFYGWFDRHNFLNTFKISEFSNSDTDCIYVNHWIQWSQHDRRRYQGQEIKLREFSYVAYNVKGKLLTTDHLLGIKRQYDHERHVKFCRRNPHSYWCGHRWSGYKRRGVSYYRAIRTTQERRWANAWDDEEFAPRIRNRRNAKNLPNAWDDIRRYTRNNNWKRYRKQQWKEKKEG